MTIRSLFAVVVLVSSLAMAGHLITPDLAHAQDGMSDEDDDYSFEDFLGEIEKDKEDQKLCRGIGDVSPQEKRDACTRLIETAPYENDLVGEYYVNRATTYTYKDVAAQCQDVRKGIEIIERTKSPIYGQKFLDAARSLEESACR